MASYVLFGWAQAQEPSSDSKRKWKQDSRCASLRTYRRSLMYFRVNEAQAQTSFSMEVCLPFGWAGAAVQESWVFK
jgi:hypothetical protein